MSNSETMKEQLHGQTNVKEQNTNKENSGEKEQLIERHPIEGSPFWIIGNKKEGYFLTFAKWRISESHKTRTDLIKWKDKNEWNIILSMILCLMDKTNVTLDTMK